MRRRAALVSHRRAPGARHASKLATTFVRDTAPPNCKFYQPRARRAMRRPTSSPRPCIRRARATPLPTWERCRRRSLAPSPERATRRQPTLRRVALKRWTRRPLARIAIVHRAQRGASAVNCLGRRSASRGGTFARGRSSWRRVGPCEQRAATTSGLSSATALACDAPRRVPALPCEGSGSGRAHVFGGARAIPVATPPADERGMRSAKAPRLGWSSHAPARVPTHSRDQRRRTIRGRARASARPSRAVAPLSGQRRGAPSAPPQCRPRRRAPSSNERPACAIGAMAAR